MCLCQSASQEQGLMLSACPEHAQQSAVWSMKLTNVSTVQLEGGVATMFAHSSSRSGAHTRTPCTELEYLLH